MGRRTEFSSEIKQLKRSRRELNLGSNGWHKNIPSSSGVYVIWEGVTALYVGESSSLRERLRELDRTINHTFRSKAKGVYKVEEKELSKFINKTFTISYLTLNRGRKELEEFLIADWDTSKFNKRPARYLRSDDCEKNI